jgi:molecular chaperone DnaK (HSP70)
LKAAPWIAAAGIVLLGVIGFVLVPRILPGKPGAAPPDGAAAPAPGSTPEAAPRTAGVPMRPHLLVVEQVSPIASAAGTLSEALGYEQAGDAFVAVLPRGAKMPATKTKLVATVNAEQRDILFHLLRGNSSRATGNHSLGWYRITDLPIGADGRAKVAVMFGVVDGAIVLAAADPATGRALTVASTPAPGR